MGRLAALVLLALVLPATAYAAPERERDRDGPVAQARKNHGATKPDDRVAGGAITVEPTEGLAGMTKTVTVTLARAERGVSIEYPDRFQARAINGRSYVPGRPAGETLTPADRSVAIDVSRLPAGTYRLPVSRGGTVIGTAVFRLYVGEREGGDGADQLRGAFGPIGRNPIDSSNDSTEESETFIAVEPGNGQRFASYGNDISFPGFGGLNITNDGGANWSHLTFPTTFDVKGSAVDETADPSGDPILAADAGGNIWAGGLDVCTVGADRIFVNRIAGPSGTTPSPKNVGLPIAHGGTNCNVNDELQDKPQMTLDTTPTSPTFGRLYVTWDDPSPGGGVNVVTAYCNTQPTPSACDSADNWTNPVKISDASASQGGSYITSDPAVGPDGKVYVAWWDFSGANAVRIDVCDPAAHGGACNATGDWGTDQIVASLSFHGGVGVPFACPTLAQPGGRAAPVPSIAIDHSGGTNNGRIYVGWSDLSTSGGHRCTDLSDAPDATQDTFKSYVASAPDYATLTADPTTLSHERGTNVIGDAGDHWFPWVAVDQSTGQAYVDLYSTRDDSTRKSAKFYARAVVPGAGSTRVSYGPLTAASSDATNYSDQDCCGFGNDYGDYTGLDAEGGNVYAVWTHRLLNQDGDVFVNVLAASAVPATPTEVPPDDATGGGPPPPPPPPPPTTTGTTPTVTLPPPTTVTTPTQPPLDRTPPRLQVTYATRVDRRGRYTVKLASAGEAASGSAVLRLATGAKRRLATGLLATSGTKPLKLVIRLKRKDLALLRRRGKLRVTLAVSLTDLAGNTARGSKTFTLRVKR